MSKIYIVMPTYNERGNIEKVLSQLFKLDIEGLNVLVVDDSSPDGTAEVVNGLETKFSNLRLLIRPRKEGLGPAYLAGFKQALAEGADFIFEMDADLSHDPKYIPEFLEAVKSNDLVLGSRYIAGGGVANWTLFRRLVSRFGNIYAKNILNMPFSDLTGGFKCYTRKAVEKILTANLSSLGYNFQIETTYILYKNSFKITEIPIIFTEREEGQSKFNLKIILEG